MKGFKVGGGVDDCGGARRLAAEERGEGEDVGDGEGGIVDEDE